MIIEEQERISNGWIYRQLKFKLGGEGMAQNSGKVFEKDFTDSIPENYFKYKLKDSPGAWGDEKPKETNSKVRFTSTNICDLVVHNGQGLFLLELKSHKGASIPIAPKTNEKGKVTNYGVIKTNQLQGLLKEYDKRNVKAGFVFNLSEKFKTYYVEAINVKQAIDEGRKSLGIEWLNLNGTIIPQAIKKRGTHQVYDTSILLN